MSLIEHCALSSAQAANEDLEVARIRQKIANGELSVTTPCDGLSGEWSSEDKAGLKEMLSSLFGWKAQK